MNDLFIFVLIIGKFFLQQHAIAISTHKKVSSCVVTKIHIHLQTTQIERTKVLKNLRENR
jgi:hypothetical protein